MPSSSSRKQAKHKSQVATTSTSSSMPETGIPEVFFETLRSVVKEMKDVEFSDEDLVHFIIDNWDDINKGVGRRLFSASDMERLKEFVEEKATKMGVDKEKHSHKSVELWLDMLEALICASRAFLRIEQFLLALSTSRPHSFAHASRLFSTLSSLPKIPRPNWVDPTVRAGKDFIVDPSTILIQMQHSFVYTSEGIVLYPHDVAEVITRDTKAFFYKHKRLNRRLTESQRERLTRSMMSFQDLQAERFTWERLQELKTKKKGRDTNTPTAQPIQEQESGSFMPLLEAYHFISKLASFYNPHPGPEFDHARILLRGLRRELQKDLTNTLRDVDFDAYLS